MSSRRRRTSPQAGFTLVEVMVAALILTLAMSALAAIFITSQNQASAAVQTSQLSGIADQQLELIRASEAINGFNALGLSATPVAQSSAVVASTFADPDKFVVAGAAGVSCLLIANNYDSINPTATSTVPLYGITAPTGMVQWNSCNSTASSSTDAEPLTILSGTSPAPIITWASGAPPTCNTSASGQLAYPCTVALKGGCATAVASISQVPNCAATVYAFVTDTFVGCGTTGAVACPGTDSGGVLQCPAASLPTSTTASTACGDARRVIVAVVPNPPNAATPGVSHPLGRLTPIYLSTLFTDPNPAGASSSSAGFTLNLNVL